MTIDGTFTWVFGWPSDPKMTRDTLKTMELGWLIKTDDSEYSTEKVNYKYYSTKDKWPRKEGTPSSQNYWRWDFINA